MSGSRLAESPAHDADDPNSPRDPNGTRADLGAYYADLLTIDADAEGLSINPNPFNERTVLRFQSGREATVSVQVYDMQGREVWETVGRAMKGISELEIEGARLGGAGVYWIRVSAEGLVWTQKVVQLR